jgi:hypothetical protein
MNHKNSNANSARDRGNAEALKLGTAYDDANAWKQVRMASVLLHLLYVSVLTRSRRVLSHIQAAAVQLGTSEDDWYIGADGKLVLSSIEFTATPMKKVNALTGALEYKKEDAPIAGGPFRIKAQMAAWDPTRAITCHTKAAPYNNDARTAPDGVTATTEVNFGFCDLPACGCTACVLNAALTACQASPWASTGRTAGVLTHPAFPSFTVYSAPFMVYCQTPGCLNSINLNGELPRATLATKYSEDGINILPRDTFRRFLVEVTDDGSPYETVITLSFKKFNLRWNDYLYIYDGVDETAPLLCQPLTGFHFPGPYRSNENAAPVNFLPKTLISSGKNMYVVFKMHKVEEKLDSLGRCRDCTDGFEVQVLRTYKWDRVYSIDGEPPSRHFNSIVKMGSYMFSFGGCCNLNNDLHTFDIGKLLPFLRPKHTFDLLAL